MERDVETLVDIQLRNKQWIDDVQNPERNVFKQTVKTTEQKTALKNTRPDYVLYREHSNEPLVVIEVKEQGKDLDKAMAQAIGYAEKIHCPIAIATDGIFLKTQHVVLQKPLYINKEEVDALFEHDLAIRFIHSNEILTIDPVVLKSREELIGIFGDLNNKLSEAGIRAGIERTEFFCNILFLKVISEIAEHGESLMRRLPPEYRWAVIREKRGRDLFDFINKQALVHFQSAYGGEVLSPIKPILNYSILDVIISKLDNLSLASTNTDIKGDAFEYFLRNYGGASTDFGEYFTPRHIVKTMVKLLNPQFGEKVYDPFCGTGGMLIESYKHMYDRMPRNKESIQLLQEHTVFGAELSEMYRIAKMNMILAGDGHSNIVRRDSYAHPQNGKYDVVITNIPFGVQRKTQYAGLYGYNTQSSEITGVLHCLNALGDSEHARAAVILPEGISNNTGRQYTSLRKQILEQHELRTIVSLSSSTFLPNTGVRANIYIIQKRKKAEGKNQIVWYFPIQNDGFTQDIHRSKVQGRNDIDRLLSENTLRIEEAERLKSLNFTPLFLSEIRKNNYSLKTSQYIHNKPQSVYPVYSLRELGLFIKKGQSITAEKADTRGSIPVIAGGRTSPYTHSASNYEGESITISASGAYAGYVWFHNYPIWASDCTVVQGNERIPTRFLYYCLKHIQKDVYALQKGTGQPHVYPADIEHIYIPLPPQDILENIMAEVHSEVQKIEECKKRIQRSEQNIESAMQSVWRKPAG